LAVIDLRGEEVIYACNRFLIYALFEQCDISMQVVPSADPTAIEFAVGKSILDRGSPVDVGQLMLEFGGGGHQSAGTCRAPLDQADRVKAELIDRITKR
jgi:nanoRNase/pAp phosphatase (c-di-AMP/oligoRNAs hydrolase)